MKTVRFPFRAKNAEIENALKGITKPVDIGVQKDVKKKNVIYSTKKPIHQEEEKAEAVETDSLSTEEGLTQGKQV